MSPRDDDPSLFDDQDGPDLSPPEESYRLYQHKNAAKIETKGWHGYYSGPGAPMRATTRYSACPPRWGSGLYRAASSLEKRSRSSTRKSCRSSGLPR